MVSMIFPQRGSLETPIGRVTASKKRDTNLRALVGVTYREVVIKLSQSAMK